MRGHKGPLLSQSSPEPAKMEERSTGPAESSATEALAGRTLERNEPVTLASFDRPAEGFTVPTSFLSMAAPAPETTPAYPDAPERMRGEPVSATMPAPRPTMPAAVPMGGEVLMANSDTFDELVIHSDVPVLVDFYADWCGPCRALSPKLHELAQEVPDVRVVKVDIDESPDIASRYQVRSIPALRVFDNGKVTARHRGLTSKKHLKTLVGR